MVQVFNSVLRHRNGLLHIQRNRSVLRRRGAVVDHDQIAQNALVELILLFDVLDLGGFELEDEVEIDSGLALVDLVGKLAAAIGVVDSSVPPSDAISSENSLQNAAPSSSVRRMSRMNTASYFFKIKPLFYWFVSLFSGGAQALNLFIARLMPPVNTARTASADAASTASNVSASPPSNFEST